MKPTRPHILFVCPAWPHGQAHGGQLRALQVGRALQQIGEVTVLVVGSDAGAEAARRKTAEEFRVVPAVRLLPAPNRTIAQKLRWAFDARYLNVHGTVASEFDRQRVLRYAREHDVTWVMNARTPSVLQIWRWPRAHLDVDDVPSAYLQAAATAATGRLARWKSRTQQFLLERRERRFGDRFTTLSVCSEADRAALGGDSVHVIPNGFARPAAAPTRTASAHVPRLGFIGLYSYPPNLDGVRWFLREAWPAILAAVPAVRFRLLGEGSDGPLRPCEASVDTLGWVEDPAAEIATWSAMTIPIRFGGGTRIKLADAFSRKCPVVSTAFGARGYAVESGHHLLFADTGPRFATACIALLQDPPRACRLAEAAWEGFLQHWSWEAITPRIHAALEDCLRRSATAASAGVQIRVR
jgi:glycosyltransferase involved in cell wall biosynthesis